MWDDLKCSLNLLISIENSPINYSLRYYSIFVLEFAEIIAIHISVSANLSKIQLYHNWLYSICLTVAPSLCEMCKFWKKCTPINLQYSSITNFMQNVLRFSKNFSKNCFYRSCLRYVKTFRMNIAYMIFWHDIDQWLPCSGILLDWHVITKCL